MHDSKFLDAKLNQKIVLIMNVIMQIYPFIITTMESIHSYYVTHISLKRNNTIHGIDFEFSAQK